MNPPNPDELKAAIAEAERRLKNQASHIVAFAECLDGLLTDGGARIPGSGIDGARDAHDIRRVVEYLRNELAAERQKREEVEKQMGVPFAELLSRCTEAWPEVVRPTGPPTVCDLVEGLVAAALNADRRSRISEDIKTAEKKILLEEIAKRSALEASNRALREAIEGFHGLLDTGVLIRDTSMDHDFAAFTKQGFEITRVIRLSRQALAQTPDEANGESCSK